MRQDLILLGDKITGALVLVYAVLALAYLTAGLWNKGLYWFGAAVLTFGVLRMT